MLFKLTLIGLYYNYIDEQTRVRIPIFRIRYQHSLR